MNTQNNKNTDKNDNVDWKEKFNDLVQTCQSELKKTTQIGMKMLSASQANSQLHETYEKLGRWLVTELDNERIKVEDQEITDLVHKVKELEGELEGFEQDVRDIKKND